MFPFQLFGSRVDTYLCQSPEAWSQTAENCGVSAVASSALVIDILFVLRRLLSMVQTILQTIEFPLSPFVFGGRCPRYAGRAVSLVPLCKDIRALTVAAR